MSATKNTSLYNQRDDIANKWKVKDVNGVVAENGDIHSFDINKEKANYGLYGYDSADEMYSAYNNDLNFVRRIDELDTAKQEQMDLAKKAEAQKLQYADTRRTLMEKYIPETLLAQGVANTGYTADALLKAENNYNQYALGAMNEKANAEQNALRSYQDAYALAKKERDQTAYKNFLEQSEIERARAELYDEYLAGLTNNTITQLDIDKALHEGLLTPEQANNLTKKASGSGAYYKTPAVYNTGGSGIRDKAGDNFSINFNGDTYRVEVGEKVVDKDIVSYAKRNVEDGGVFMTATNTNAPVYIYYNGNVYRVDARPNNNKLDFARLRKALWDTIPG